MTRPPRETAPTPASKGGERSIHVHSTQPLMVRGLRAGAEYLGIGHRKMWSLVNCNAIPHRRINTAIMFVVAELHEWVALDCPTEADAAKRVRASLRKRGGR